MKKTAFLILLVACVTLGCSSKDDSPTTTTDTTGTNDDTGNDDTGNDDTSNVDLFISDLTEGNWYISLLENSGTDETCDYINYEITFNTNGSVSAVSSTLTKNGSWTALENSGTLDLTLNFELDGTDDPFQELNHDWDVQNHSSILIELIDANSGTDYLNFSTQPFTDCDVLVNAFIAELTAESWYVNLLEYYVADETCLYIDYEFTFNTDGTVSAVSSTTAKNGVWTALEDADTISLTLDFENTGNNDPFFYLNKDWRVTNYTNETIELIVGWLSGNHYLNFGRDPYNNCDVLCSGPLRQISRGYYNTPTNNILHFTNSGTEFASFTEDDFYVTVTYENGLIKRWSYIGSYGETFATNWFYNNGNLSQIVHDDGPNISIEQNGNAYESHHQFLPPTIPFEKRIELDPNTQQITRQQAYAKSGDYYYYTDSTFIYDAAMENVIQMDIDHYSVNLASGELSYNWSKTEFITYFTDTLNPAYTVYQDHKLQMFLSDIETYTTYSYSWFPSFLNPPSILNYGHMACFSKNLIKELETDFFNNTYSLTTCTEPSDIVSYISEPVGGLDYRITFEYE